MSDPETILLTAAKMLASGVWPSACAMRRQKIVGDNNYTMKIVLDAIEAGKLIVPESCQRSFKIAYTARRKKQREDAQTYIPADPIARAIWDSKRTELKLGIRKKKAKA